MKKENIHIRINAEKKKNFQLVCDDLGVTMSEILQKYINEIINRESVDFNLREVLQERMETGLLKRG